MSAGVRLSNADFRTLRPTRRIQGTFFSLAIAKHDRGTAYATVVSKKVSNKAVTRNKVKRRCRSVLMIELKNINGPMALIFTAKRGAGEISFLETKKDIETLLSRAGLRGTISGT